MENKAEYKDIESASKEFGYLKKLAGAPIKKKDTNKEYTVQTVTIYPCYSFESKERVLIGFDIRLYLKEDDTYINSKDIQYWNFK